MSRARAVVLGLALLAPIGAAASQCGAKPIAGSEAAFEDILLQRLRPMGVGNIVQVARSGGKDYFRLSGTSTRLFLITTADQVTSVGAALSAPGSPSDVDLMNAIAAFTMSKISGLPESEIAVQLRPMIAALPIDGKSVKNFGTATIIMTKTKDLTSLVINQIAC